MTEKADAGERFWRFSLAVYTPGAARAAFLALQDRDGADVPMLLYALWRGAQGEAIGMDCMVRALEFSREWRAAHVEPLRSLRRGWKGGCDGLPPALSEAARQCAARAEQGVERLQMEHLAALEDPEARAMEPEAAMRANLQCYLERGGLALDPERLEAAVLAATAHGTG